MYAIRSYYDEQRNIFVLMLVERSEKVGRTGGVHEELPYIVQQSAGEGQIGINARLLGQHAGAGGDAEGVLPEDAGAEAGRVRVVAVDQRGSQDDGGNPVGAEEKERLAGRSDSYNFV